MLKSELRKHIRELKNGHSYDDLLRLSLPIIETLRKNAHVGEAKTILLYYSLKDEVFTHDLCQQLHDEGVTVLLPVIVGDGKMILRRYNGRQSMQPDMFNILEPTGGEFTDYNLIDVAIIPGMAFDRPGNRLGRGKGFYDRFLPLIPKAWKIGLCFPFQLVDKVPTEPTDISMDEVVS